MSKYVAQHRRPGHSRMLRRGGISLVTFGVVASSVVPAHACGLAASMVQDSVAESASSSFQPALSSAPEIDGSYGPVAQAIDSSEQSTPVASATDLFADAQSEAAPDTDSVRPAVFDEPESVQTGPLDAVSNPVAVTPQVTRAATANDTTTAVNSPVARTQQSTKPTTSTTYNARRDQIVRNALAGIGGNYVWGGHSYRSWDCAGFVSYVYGQSGVELDSYTYSMKNQLTQTTNPQPGDIVFANGFSHVGIYLGNGQMVSALNPTQGTAVTSVDGGGLMHVDGYFTAPGL